MQCRTVAMVSLTPANKSAIASGIPEEELFTPLWNGERVLMRVPGIRSLERGPGFKGQVKDELSGKRYNVFGAPCPLPACYCDARVTEVV